MLKPGFLSRVLDPGPKNVLWFPSSRLMASKELLFMVTNLPPHLAGLHRLVWMALLAALTAVGAYLHFPLWGVPFSMQPFFVILAGLLLGPRDGALCIALYVAAGCIGLPVFAGGKAGLATLLGPTGGYLVGFIAAAGCIGLAVPSEKGAVTWARGILWGLVALAVTYGFGVGGLALALDLTLAKAVAIGFVPFILPDLVKLAAAVAVQRFLAARGLVPQ
jgi:biotin transport system substrate-specific component